MKYTRQLLLISAFTISPLMALEIINHNAPQEQRENTRDYFDIDARDPVAGDTFRALYHDHCDKGADRPYLIAQFETKKNNQTSYQFHSAASLYGRIFQEQTKQTLERTMQTARTLAPFVNESTIVRVYKISSLESGSSAQFIQRIEASSLIQYANMALEDHNTDLLDPRVTLIGWGIGCLSVLFVFSIWYILFGDFCFGEHKMMFENGLLGLRPQEIQSVLDFLARLRHAR